MKRRIFIQKVIYLIAALKLIPSQLFSNISLDFRGFEEAWDVFISDPSPINSKNVYNAIPLYNYYDRSNELRVANKIHNDLIHLENYLLCDNQESVKVAYKLHSVSDGAAAEYLCIMLGQYIKINPENFLIELKDHYHLVILPGLLGNYGPEFVDEFSLQNIETKKRIDALSSVKRRTLEPLKRICIRVLEKNYIPTDVINKLNGF